MSINPESFINKDITYNNKVIYDKLNEFFGENVKKSLKTTYKLFVITKDDIFYEINIHDERILPFIVNNDISIIDSMIVQELCFKEIIDLSYGICHYIARTNDKIYCWGNNSLGQLGNGKIDNLVTSIKMIKELVYNFWRIFGKSNPFSDRYFLEQKSENKPQINEILSNLNLVDIKCGAFHSLALTQSGEVYAWGFNLDGQTGVGSELCLRSIPYKVNGFENEKMIMISCGSHHSMALAESGRAYSWGCNDCGQLGIGNKDKSLTPKLIEISDVLIVKISCGQTHSTLLTNDGVIYVFGSNDFRDYWNKNNKMNLSPTKLNQEMRFIDIASHHKLYFSACLSYDGVYYVFDDKNFEKTIFNSFIEVFQNKGRIQYELSDRIIEFIDPFFREGYYDQEYHKEEEEEEELGRGSFGTVFKVSDHKNKLFAIKKIRPVKGSESQFLQEFIRYSVAYKIESDFIVKHFDAWFENDINGKLTLFLEMELCDKTLEEIIDEFDKDINLKVDEILTPIGYYIASELFIEILESVHYLHNNNIIHRDLNPYNILIKRTVKGNKFIKIGDFGLISIHENAEKLHSVYKGQVKYTAPEVEERKAYDTKADIYSLGILLQNLFDIPFEE
jgi:tRNA A-37 threonylcarbamoyl transferase component Bud32